MKGEDFSILPRYGYGNRRTTTTTRRSRYGYGNRRTTTTTPKPVTCDWSQWSDWSQPTETCGDVNVERSRTCDCSDGSQKKDETCGSDSYLESKLESLPECVTCDWSQWTEWAPYPGQATCGTVQGKRSKTCDCSDGSKKKPLFCPPGVWFMSDSIELPACVTCKFSKWSDWSQPSKTCGEDSVKKTRTCDCSDGSTGEDDSCGSGDLVQTKKRDLGKCEDPGDILEEDKAKKWTGKKWTGKKWTGKKWSTTTTTRKY